jgi:hypothetical protein
MGDQKAWTWKKRELGGAFQKIIRAHKIFLKALARPADK